MKSFREYSLVEANTRAAFEMETSIVKAANNDTHTSKLVKKESAKKVIKFLNSKGVRGEGKMPKSIYPTNSKKWDVYFPGKRVSGATKTPKTDLMIGDTRISLKTGPAQLTSGGRGEASALFFNAIERSGKKPSELAIDIKNGISKLAPSTVASVKGNVRQILKSEKDKILNKADKLNHELKKKIKDLFSTNDTVANYFTEEAMSGQIKFSGGEGYATHILVTDFNGDNNRIYKTNDKSYVSKITSQVNPQVRMKSTSVKKSGVKTGFYRYWGIVSLITEEVIDKEMNMLIEELEQEGLLQEGLFDTLAKKGREILDRMNNTLKNIKDKLINFFTRAIDFIRDSWQNVLEFFDLDVEVTHRNYISW